MTEDNYSEVLTDKEVDQEVRTAHTELTRMMTHWAQRDAFPVSVAVVFCTGLLVTLRGYLSHQHYQKVVSNILEGVEKIHDSEGEETDERDRTVH